MQCVLRPPLGIEVLYREVVSVQRSKSIAKELLVTNQVVFIERWSLYRGQSQYRFSIAIGIQLFIERWSLGYRWCTRGRRE